MVAKTTEKSIDDAIELGKQNQQKDKYLNWCKYLHIDLLSTSPLGQAVRLPIGPHEIFCDYYAGGQSVNVELLATHFIQKHCPDCPYHVEVNEHNLGKIIVEEERKRRARLSPALAARKKIQELVQITDPVVTLQQDVRSDRNLLEVLLLLEDKEHQQKAADKILAVAQELDVQLFSQDALRVLTIYFTDAEIGAQAISITRTLCSRHATFFDVVIDPAIYAFADGHQREALAFLLGDYVDSTAKTAQVVTLIPALMAHHSTMLGVGTHRPSAGVIHALKAIARQDIEPILQEVETRLKRGDKESRLEACDALEILLDDYPAVGERVLSLLLRSLEFDDDRYERSADGATLNILAHVVSQNLELLTIVEQFYAVATPDLKALTFRFYQHLAKLSDDEKVHRQCAEKAIHILAAGIDHIDTLLGAAAFLVDIARTRPAIVADHVNSLIGALALVADRPSETQARQARDGLDALNKMGLSAQWTRVVSDLEKAIATASENSPETVALALRSTIAHTSSKTAGAFKSHLISALGKISQDHLSVAQDAVPLLFGLLIDTDSTLVRGSAARAFGDMSRYQGDILPTDVLDLMKELLLRETYVYVLLNLIRAFRHIPLPDIAFANVICGALAVWERSFDDATQKEQTAGTLFDVASEFESLRAAVKPLFERYCRHDDYWIRIEYLEKWFRWSQQYSEYTLHEFVKLSLQFYRDLPAETRDLNGLEQPFENMMKVPREFFAEQVTELVEIAQGQGGEFEWNERDFATLLAVKEYYAESAQLYRHVVGALPDEPRLEKLRRYLRSLAIKNTAEAYVLNGDLSRAQEQLKEAADFVDQDSTELEEIQIVLRQRLLHTLAGFDLTNVGNFITNVQALRQSYGELFEGHFLEIHETDDNFFRSLDNLLEALAFLGQWGQASLGAEQNSNRYLEAAQYHLDIAIDLAKQSDSALYAERVNLLELILREITRPREISSFIRNVVAIPIPLIFDYRTKDNWGGAKFRQRFLKAEGLEDTALVSENEPEEVRVAQVVMTVDGQPVDKPLSLQAALHYGLGLQLRFARWPARYARLELRFFSTTPAANQLVKVSLERPSNYNGQITADSHIIFEHSLSPAAPPIEAKLVASFIDVDGKEHRLDLFGKHDLTVRVSEKPASQTTYNVSVSNSEGFAIGDNAQVIQARAPAPINDEARDNSDG
ncbi:MAG: hypothetical protein IT331_13595 [Anaerolineae bacterium]|nr:hypothetical protein [Anaerolineae bacterium]